RLGRSGPPIALAALGAILLAGGLVVIAFVPAGSVPLIVLALLVCGAGLGLAFTSLTAAALGGSGSATTRAGRTVVARDAGLVIGLLILTPIFVGDLNAAPQKAIPNVAGAVAAAPLPDSVKSELGTGLVKVYSYTPQGSLPDLDPAFAPVRRDASGSTVQQLGALESRL